MQEFVINVPETLENAGMVLLGAAGGIIGYVKLWWARKTKEQKIAFLRDVNKKGEDGKITISEVIELAEVHM